MAEMPSFPHSRSSSNSIHDQSEDQSDLPLLPLKASVKPSRISFREPGQLALREPKRWRSVMLWRAQRKELQLTLQNSISEETQLIGELRRRKKNINQTQAAYPQSSHVYGNIRVSDHATVVMGDASYHFGDQTERDKRQLQMLMQLLEREREPEQKKRLIQEQGWQRQRVLEQKWVQQLKAERLRCQQLVEARAKSQQLVRGQEQIQIQDLNVHLEQAEQRQTHLHEIEDNLKSSEREEKSLLNTIATFEKKDFNNLLRVYDTLCVSKSTIADVYRELEGDQIRVMILDPAPNYFYPLIGTLRTASLRDGKLKYVAVSYHWGTDSPQDSIYISPGSSSPNLRFRISDWERLPHDFGKCCYKIPIQSNLFSALVRFRRTDRAVALWVDTLCINQKNAVEKTKQLRMMPDIYHMAKCVCVWLGESDDEGRSDLAMAFIPQIIDLLMLKKYLMEKQYARHWAGLAELMRDRWFSRRWVVQEIAFAKEATVHCGGEMVQWADFVDAISLLVGHQEAIKKLFDFSEWRYGPNTMGDIQSFGANVLLRATSNLFLRTAEGGIVRPVKKLEFLVTNLKTFDTSNPRDIIYSLVSIASDTFGSSMTYKAERKDVSADHSLTVDYRQSEVAVYQDFTRFCINSSGSLDIICRPWATPLPMAPKGDGTEHYQKLPSWIPLLSDAEFGGPSEVFTGRKNGDNLVGPVGQPHYKAAGDTRAETDMTHDFSLIATGFQLASVDRVSQRHTAGLILRESLRMGGWSGIENNMQSVPEKIWRTLIADRDSNGEIPPRWYQRVCQRCLESSDTFNNGDLNIGHLLQEDSEILRDYLNRVRDVTWNRRFFISKVCDTRTNDENLRSNRKKRYIKEGAYSTNKRHKEHSARRQNEGFEDLHDTEDNQDTRTVQETPEIEYELGVEETSESNDTSREGLFGLCPADTKEGDLICILSGCSIPVILRKHELGSNTFFELIGEVYVHGKMDGEAMVDLDEGRTLTKLVRLHLR